MPGATLVVHGQNQAPGLDRGTYALILELGANRMIPIGGLGTLDFQCGTYCYIGSAWGSGSSSLSRRVLRHLSRTKRAFWHIDYLTSLPWVTISRVVLGEGARAECEINQEIATKGTQIRGFGSSDCRRGCIGHLTLMTAGDLETVPLVLDVFRRRGCAPRMQPPDTLIDMHPSVRQ